MFTVGGTYPWSFVTQIFHKGHGGDRKASNILLKFLDYIFSKIYIG